jgi:hypothetical protein
MKFILHIFVVVAAFSVLCSSQNIQTLRVAAFNIKTFGAAKMENTAVVNCLKQVNNFKALSTKTSRLYSAIVIL